MNWVLQSLRLELQPCTDADIDLLLDHWTQPSVRRYLFDDRITDWETVAGFVAASQASFQKYNYGLWVLIGTENQFQGVCGFCDPLEKCDLIFSIAPLYWGQGLATESAQCVRQYAFDTLKFPQITSTVDQPNKASIKVLEKLGMSLVKEALNNNNPILYYALTAKDYYSQNLIS